MYQNMYHNPMGYRNQYNRMNMNNDRFVGGGFLAPFVLGGITGGLLAPAFYPRPYYRPPGPVYQPYPPYYRPF